MLRNFYLVFAMLICSGVIYSRLTGYELGNDAASGWTQQGANRYHK